MKAEAQNIADSGRVGIRIHSDDGERVLRIDRHHLDDYGVTRIWGSGSGRNIFDNFEDISEAVTWLLTGKEVVR